VIVRMALALSLSLALVACGDDGSEAAKARVYFLRGGKVWPVERAARESDVVAKLEDGPSAEETENLGAMTEIRRPNPGISKLSISDGVATYDPAAPVNRRAKAQVVYTLTQFPGIKTVEIDGKHYKRADFEKQTPQILVESPLPFEEVQTPLRVTGTANTFEATFEYELKDSQGMVVDSNFVTATSGTGTRGTFDFRTKAADDVASLVVFERSAKDGSRINEVEIPLRTR
jgi:germination protein M